jgi:hypothetical protein
MRRGRCVVSWFRMLGVLLPLLAALGVIDSSKGVALVRTTPIPPPANIAAQFDALTAQFKSEQSGYACYSIEGMQDGFNCLLGLPCSMSIIFIERASIRGFAMNFGGTFFLRDSRCAQSFFLSQVEAMLELFNALSKGRAHEIIMTMDQDPQRFGRCNPDSAGDLPEGRGSLSYGRDEAVLKIFCWFVK